MVGAILLLLGCASAAYGQHGANLSQRSHWRPRLRHPNVRPAMDKSAQLGDIQGLDEAVFPRKLSVHLDGAVVMAKFTDTDLGWNQIGGPVTLFLNTSEGGKADLLWGFNDSCTGLGGEDAIMSMEWDAGLPLPCEGVTCGDISSEYLTDTRIRVSHWQVDPQEYGTFEKANFTVSGPATVTFHNFSTEADYDFITFYRRSMEAADYSGTSMPPSHDVAEGEAIFIRWTSDKAIGDRGWIFEVEYGTHAPRREVEFMVPNGTVIPQGADKLLVEENATVGLPRCVSAPLADYVPTMEVAMNVSFVDVDFRKNIIGGTMVIMRTLPLPSEDHEFRVFLQDMSANEVLGSPIASISGTSADHVLQAEIPVGTSIDGMSVLVYAANSSGQALTPYVVEIQDAIAEVMPEGTFNFTDKDARLNMISGTTIVLLNVTDRTTYELVWGADAETCRRLEGQAVLASKDLGPGGLPPCKGHTCSNITSEHVNSNTVRVSNYHYWPETYDTNEEAEFTVFGPGWVSFSQFSTESGRDFIYYNPDSSWSTQASGYSSPPNRYLYDGDTLTIRWTSDILYGSRGWRFNIEYYEPTYSTQWSGEVEFTIPDGTMIPSGAKSLLLMDNNTCIIASLDDYVPSVEVAQNVSFTDMDQRSGVFGGVMNITRSLPLPSEDHEFKVYLHNLVEEQEVILPYLAGKWRDPNFWSQTDYIRQYGYVIISQTGGTLTFECGRPSACSSYFPADAMIGADGRITFLFPDGNNRRPGWYDPVADAIDWDNGNRWIRDIREVLQVEIASVTATSNDETVQVNIPFGMPLRGMAFDHILSVYSANATGQALTPYVIPLDSIADASTPQGVFEFTDSDPGWNRIGGVATVAFLNASSGVFNLLWGYDHTCSALRGETPIMSVSLGGGNGMPPCEGRTCGEITSELLSANRVRVSNWHEWPSEYANHERADFTIQGPGTVIFTQFDTEPNYDYIYYIQPETGIILRRYSGSSLPLDYTIPSGDNLLIRWTSDYSITEQGWTFEVEYGYGERQTYDRVEFSVPAGLWIPAGANKLILDSIEDGFCLEAPLEDYVPTTEVAQHVSFVDTDAHRYFIGGTMQITRSSPPPSEDIEFRVFLHEQQNTSLDPDQNLSQVLNNTPIASVYATANDLVVEVEIPSGTPFHGMPFFVYAANSSGQALTPYQVGIQDLALPQYPPLSGRFIDKDPASEVVEGDLAVQRHPEDDVSTRWALYWASENQSAVGDRLMIVGHAGMPRCHGPTCSEIRMERLGSDGSWLISRGFYGYGAFEGAKISFPVDGFCEIDARYGWPMHGSFAALKVEEENSASVKRNVTVRYTMWLRCGTLFWTSFMASSSSAEQGWQVRYRPDEGQHMVQLPSLTLPDGIAGMLIKAADVNSGTVVESDEGLFIPVSDFTPPTMTATDVSFTDTDLIPGYLTGDVVITRDLDDINNGVQGYCVAFTATAMMLPHHPWEVPLMGCKALSTIDTSASSFSVNLPGVLFNPQLPHIIVVAYGPGVAPGLGHYTQMARQGVSSTVVDVDGLTMPTSISPYFKWGSGPTSVTVTISNSAPTPVTLVAHMHLQPACTDASIDMDSLENSIDDAGPSSPRRLVEAEEKVQEAAISSENRRIAIKLKDSVVSELGETLEMYDDHLQVQGIFSITGKLGNWLLARVTDEKVDLTRLCMSIKKRDFVLDCEQDEFVPAPAIFQDESSQRRLQEQVMPDDPYFSRLSAFNHHRDIDIDAPEAWRLHTGTGQTIVAVIDSGVARTHPDLAPNMWTNPGEIPDNNIDDDGNGFVDDVYGWDFYYGDKDPSPSGFAEGRWHGTHIAGTIAAVGNNSIGVPGINWNAKIMNLRVSTGDDVYTFAIGSAIYYAVDNGAHVLCLALSTTQSGFIKDALRYAESRGVLAVTSAGHGASPLSPYGTYLMSTLRRYPCLDGQDQANILCVGGVDPLGFRYLYSNYGNNYVHIGAPAVDIYSTVGNGAYDYRSGTSMSTAIVAGAASLLRDMFPHAPWQAIKQGILLGADEVPELGGEFAHGRRLNLHKAMLLIGNSYWAVLPQSNTTDSMQMTVEVPASSSADIEILIGNKALCADRENTPVGALRFSGNGFHYRHSVPILPQVGNYSSIPASAPASCQFTDTDMTEGIIAGPLHVTAPMQPSEDFEEYSVWWASSTTGGISHITDIPASGASRGMSNAPAWDELLGNDNSFWSAFSGAAHIDGKMVFSGPFSEAYGTLAQMFEAPFEIYLEAHNSSAVAPVMVQIGGHGMGSMLDSAGGIMVTVTTGNSRMVRLPDGSTYMSSPCPHSHWDHHVIHITVLEESINVSGIDDHCPGINVSYSLTGTHHVKVGADCWDDCRHAGAALERIAYRSHSKTVGYTLSGLSPPSGADQLLVKTKNHFGEAMTGISCTLVDRSTADDPVPPSAVTASQPTFSTMLVSWTVNSLNSCIFSAWKVEAQVWSEGMGGNWFVPSGCADTSSTTSSCVLEGLESNTAYRFRVLPVCSFGDGMPSEPSSAASTAAINAMAPYQIVTTPVSVGSTTVTWQLGALNDCDFAEFLVHMRADGTSSWSVPTGCTGLVSLSSASCSAQGLSSALTYQFKVQVLCEDDTGNSPWSAVSASTSSSVIGSSRRMEAEMVDENRDLHSLNDMIQLRQLTDDRETHDLAPQAARLADVEVKYGNVSGMLHMHTKEDPDSVDEYHVYFGNSNGIISGGLQHQSEYLSCMGDMCKGADFTWDPVNRTVSGGSYSPTHWSSSGVGYPYGGEKTVVLVKGPMRVSRLHGDFGTDRDTDLLFVDGKLASNYGLDHSFTLPPGPQGITFWMMTSVNGEWSVRFEDITEDAPGRVGTVRKASDSPVTSMYIPNQAIPAGATHFLIYHTDDVANEEPVKVPITRPTENHMLPDPPAAVSFEDTNFTVDAIAGDLIITAPAQVDSQQISHYNIYWGTTSQVFRESITGWRAKYWEARDSSVDHTNVSSDAGDYDVLQEGIEPSMGYWYVSSSYRMVAIWRADLWIEDADTHRFKISQSISSDVLIIRIDGMEVFSKIHQTSSGDSHFTHYLGHGWHEFYIEFSKAGGVFGSAGLKIEYAGADTFYVLNRLDYRIKAADKPPAMQVNASANGANLTINDMEMGGGATHLHVFSVDDTGAESAVGTRVAPDRATAQAAEGMDFVDVHPGLGVIGGDVKIIGDLHTLQDFNLYWADVDGNRFGDMLGTVLSQESGRRSCGKRGHDDTQDWLYGYYYKIYSYYDYGSYSSVMDVVNGRVVTPCEWPWQVHIYGEDRGYHFCGGTLIAPRWVVTAAHCQHPTSWTSVTVGKHSWGDDTIDRIRAKRWIIHEQYGSWGYGMDIALIELVRDAVESECIGYACLPQRAVQPGTECYTTGWGWRSKSGRNSPRALREAPVKILPNADCADKYVFGDSVTEDMLCTVGMESVGTVGACHGDSGGPVVCPTDGNRWELFGAVSWGYGCAAWSFPDINADVYFFRDWILGKVDNSVLELQSGGVVTYNLTATVPTDAVYLMAVPQTDGIEGDMDEAVRVRIKDFAPPEAGPTAIELVDVDASQDEVVGRLVIHCASSEDRTDLYRVYWSYLNEIQSLGVFIEMPTCATQRVITGDNTLSEVSIWIERNISFRESDPIVLRAHSVSLSGGESIPVATAHVFDYVEWSAPQALNFADEDPLFERIGGVVAWDTNVLNGSFILYWGSSPSCNGTFDDAITTLHTTGSQRLPTVTCDEDRSSSCSVIDISSYSNGVAVSRGSYNNHEEAFITVSGPGSITFTHFDTESWYDYIYISRPGHPPHASLSGSGSSYLQTFEVSDEGLLVRWYTDYSVTRSGWRFWAPIQSSVRGLPATIPMGTIIPNAASYFVLIRQEVGVADTCAIMRIQDFAPSTEVAADVTFIDMDPSANEIRGTVNITRTLPVPGHTTNFSVYLGSMHEGIGLKAMPYPLVSVLATPADATVAVEMPFTKLPTGTGSHLLVYASNSTGQALQPFGLVLMDYFVLEYPPTNATFTDTDERAGVVGGRLTVAKSEKDVLSTIWNVYWSNGGAIVGLMTAIQQANYPRCEGRACGLIEINPGSRPGSWNVSRTAYGDFEEATITFSGPAWVRCSWATAEASTGLYHMLMVAGVRRLGSTEAEFWVSAGEQHALWYSGLGSGMGTGWMFEYSPEGPPTLHLPSMSVPMGVDGLLIKASTTTGIEGVDGLVIPLEDFAPPQVVAAGLTFTDVDTMIGRIAGTAEIARATNDWLLGVKAYCLYLANSSNHHDRQLIDCQAVSQGGSATLSVVVTSHSIWNATDLVVLAQGQGGTATSGFSTRILDDASGLSILPQKLAPKLHHGSPAASFTVTVKNLGEEPLTLSPWLNLESTCGSPGLEELLRLGAEGQISNDGYDMADMLYSNSHVNATTNYRRLTEASQNSVSEGSKRVIFKLQDGKSDGDKWLMEQTLVEQYGLLEVQHLEFVGLTIATTKDAEDLCEKLANDPRVKFCELDQPLLEASAGPESMNPRQLTENVMQQVRTWAFNHAWDEDIDASEAWAIHTGTGNRVVAVVDTGVAYHSDLNANMWENPGEIAGDGIDNDGNGYVDDVDGWDFARDRADPRPDSWAPEEYRHRGTHMAGIIGGIGNNDLGVIGVNRNVKIMPLKVYYGSSMYTHNLLRALDYAVKMGANIICGHWQVDVYYLHMLEEALRSIARHGVLVVGTTGDSYSRWYSYPMCANLQETAGVICVGPTDPAGLPYSDTTTQTPWHNVHLGAPGVEVWSTTYGGGHGPMSGAAVAAAFVAGAASLVWDFVPEAPWWIIKGALLAGADKDMELSSYYPGGRRLNLFKALIVAKRAYWAAPSFQTFELPAMSQTDITLQLGNELVCKEMLWGKLRLLVHTNSSNNSGLTRRLWGSVEIQAEVVNFTDAPQSVPASIEFTDTDMSQGAVGGPLRVTSSSPIAEEHDYQAYSLWWANSEGPISHIVNIPFAGPMDNYAMHTFGADDAAWWLPDAGLGYTYHDNMLSFMGPFAVAHRTMTQMVQAPFEMAFHVKAGMGAFGALMVQIGEDMPLRVVIGSDSSLMVVLPDGQPHSRACMTSQDGRSTWVHLDVHEEVIQVFHADGRCPGLNVSYALTGSHTVKVGADCTGSCSGDGTSLMAMGFRNLHQNTTFTLDGLQPPSTADHLMVRTSNAFGEAETGIMVLFADNWTPGDPIPPSNVVASSPSFYSMHVAWTANSLQSCMFNRWKVEAMAMPSGSWFEPSGCSIEDSSIDSCNAAGLESNTPYVFRVLPVCDGSGDGAASEPSLVMTTLLVGAVAPQDVVTTALTLGSTTVSWQAGGFNDCVFKTFQLMIRTIGESSWYSVEGCTNLNSANQAYCTASSLDAANSYQFRVATVCKDDIGNSPWSTPSSGTVSSTSDVAAPDRSMQADFVVAEDYATVANNETKSQEVISAFTAAFEEALERRRLQASSIDVSLRQGSPVSLELQSPLEVLVTVQGEHSVDSSTLESKVDSALTSSTSIQGGVLSTEVSNISSAFPPDMLAPGVSPNGNNVELRWSPLPLNDCSFSSYKVEAYLPDLGGQDSTFIPIGCTGLTQLSQPSCIATELLSGRGPFDRDFYDVVFTVSAVCFNSITNSPQSEAVSVSIPLEAETRSTSTSTLTTVSTSTGSTTSSSATSTSTSSSTMSSTSTTSSTSSTSSTSTSTTSSSSTSTSNSTSLSTTLTGTGHNTADWARQRFTRLGSAWWPIAAVLMKSWL